jgi:hypothetical protein
MRLPALVSRTRVASTRVAAAAAYAAYSAFAAAEAELADRKGRHVCFTARVGRSRTGPRTQGRVGSGCLHELTSTGSLLHGMRVVSFTAPARPRSGGSLQRTSGAGRARRALSTERAVIKDTAAHVCMTCATASAAVRAPAVIDTWRPAQWPPSIYSRVCCWGWTAHGVPLPNAGGTCMPAP